MFSEKYKFWMQISSLSNGAHYLVNPIYADSNATKTIQDVSSGSGKESIIDIGLIFQLSEFDLINDRTIGTEFILKAFEYDAPSTAVDYAFKIRFTKMDCDFDTDDKTVKVKGKTLNPYTKVIEGIDREFDLIKLQPKITPVNVKKQPILQINVFGSDFISNYLGGTQWETVKNGDFNEGINVKERYYIPGDSSTLTQDVSGSYFVDGAGMEHVREDNAYTITFNSDFGVNKWEIKASGAPGVVLYRATDTSNLPNAGDPFDLPAIVFENLTDGSTVSIYRIRIFMRILADVTNIGGTPTVAIIAGDTEEGNENYGYVLGVDEDVISISSEHSTGATKFGKFDGSALQFPTEYFVEPNGVDLPLQRSNWTAYSLWLTYNTVLNDLQEDGGKFIVLEHCYKLPDVLSVLLNELDSDISHENLIEYSNFFYGVNSVRGTKRMPLITPKSNLIVAQYDKPASTAKIRLSDVLSMLMYVYNVSWYIDEENRFILEHIDFFYRGKQYYNDNVGKDLTTLIEPKTGQVWDYRQDKHTFKKSEIYERIVTNWMDKQSLVFEGEAIEMLDEYVTKGNIEDRPIGLFSSDIDFMLANAVDISKDGFFLMDAIESHGEFTLPFVPLSVYGYNTTVQNGYLSLAFLSSFYHRYNMPSYNAKINNDEVLAFSIKRTKIQPVEFPMSDFDAMELVKTGMGIGQIDKIVVNLHTEIGKGTIKHNIILI